MALAEQHIDTSTSWRPSNIEPLRRVLPEFSPLQAGVPMLDRIMFAFSNTEFKPLMFLYGLDSNPTHRSSIHQRLAPLLPDSWDSRPQPGNTVRIVRTFIAPPGFAQEPIEYHFATTPLGETIAKDSAAFLLQRAVDLGIPFGPILQERTEDTDIPTRAYITRIATLMALKEGPLSQVKLQDRIRVDFSLLAWNLRVLSGRKLISYEAADPEVKGQQIYERADLSRLLPRVSILARNILKYFELNETGNNYTIARALGRDDIHGIGETLRQLMRIGVIRPTKWVWTDCQSTAKIMPLGERFIDELVIPLLAAYSGDEHALRMLVEARTELEQNPAIATMALDQYKRQRLLTPEAETHQAILTFIREDGPQRRRQILSHIGEKAHPQLLELVANGQLKRVRDGNASFYMLSEAKDEPRRTEEIIIVDFNPPSDLLDRQEHRIRDEYRSELDTVEFWQRVQQELLCIPADRHTARSFFLQYDPRYNDWARRWYSGIFSNHIRALWSLGIEQPWEFIRSYKPEDAPPELQEVVRATQEVMNKVLPVEYSPRVTPRIFYKHVERLATPEFWRELATDVQNTPPNTTIESFLWRFDPNCEGNMGKGHHHGKYYNFRRIFDNNTVDGAILLLIEYYPPEDASVETLLAVREAQAVLRKHLVIRDVLPDDFSDIGELRKRQTEEMQKRKESQDRLLSLKSFFGRFQDFSDAEMARLATTTVEQVRRLRTNIKGHDTDEASFSSTGFETKKYEGTELVADPFPAELRAAYLVLAFEQSRNGRNIPQIPTHREQWMFRNGEVKAALATLERYLSYYENQARKKNPQAVLPTSVLIDQLKKYVGS